MRCTSISLASGLPSISLGMSSKEQNLSEESNLAVFCCGSCVLVAKRREFATVCLFVRDGELLGIVPSAAFLLPFLLPFRVSCRVNRRPSAIAPQAPAAPVLSHSFSVFKLSNFYSFISPSLISILLLSPSRGF